LADVAYDFCDQGRHSNAARFPPPQVTLCAVWELSGQRQKSLNLPDDNSVLSDRVLDVAMAQPRVHFRVVQGS
jgi:hypothetical protein